MQLSLLARVLWAAGFAELVALLLVLLVRKRWRMFPVFTGWIAFQVAETMGLFALYRSGQTHLYAYCYWTCEVVDLLMQVSIVVELARNVLRPAGKWVRQARSSFVLFALIGGIIAMGITIAASPSVPHSLDDWVDKGSLFSAMLNVQLFFAMMLASSRLGLVWRNHVVGIATGWALWALVDLFVEAASTYFGNKWHGMVLDQVRIVAFQLATIYWGWNLWLSEPQQRTLSLDITSRLSGLQQDIEQGLQSAKHIERI